MTVGSVVVFHDLVIVDGDGVGCALETGEEQLEILEFLVLFDWRGSFFGRHRDR